MVPELMEKIKDLAAGPSRGSHPAAAIRPAAPLAAAAVAACRRLREAGAAVGRDTPQIAYDGGRRRGADVGPQTATPPRPEGVGQQTPPPAVGLHHETPDGGDQTVVLLVETAYSCVNEDKNH